jgi:hypothetical protein
MSKIFRPQPRPADVPIEHRGPIMPSELVDFRLFPGWGPRI